MLKKNKIVFLVSLILLFVGLLNFKPVKKTNIINEEKTSVKIARKISMNLEQTAGEGDYKTVTESEWPTKGYKFNTELSRCENGGELSWDDNKGVVTITGNISDRCYVYFDKVKVSSLTLEENFISPISIGVIAKSDNSGDYEITQYYWGDGKVYYDEPYPEDYTFAALDLNSEVNACVQGEDKMGNLTEIVCQKFNTLPYTKPKILKVESDETPGNKIDLTYQVYAESSDTNLTYNYVSYDENGDIYENITSTNSSIQTTGTKWIDYVKYCFSITDSYVDIMEDGFYDNEVCYE